jgi:hypothetical protein
MNRLLLLLFLLLSSLSSYQQANHLFIKKGVHKKKTYSQGDRIHIQLQNGQDKKGIITLLRNNIVYINGEAIPKEQIAVIILDEVKKRKFPADVKTILAISGGVALTTIGLSLNDANKPETALIAASVIGFGPLLLKYFAGRILYTLKRKKYSIGKKFRLQVFDMYIPPQRPF